GLSNGGLDRAQIGGNTGVFRCQLLDIAALDVGRHDPSPFGARTAEPTAASQQARGMERVAGNEQLHPLAPAQVGADNDPLGGAAVMQKQDLERVAEIVVVELVVTDTVK